METRNIVFTNEESLMVIRACDEAMRRSGVIVAEECVYLCQKMKNAFSQQQQVEKPKEETPAS